MAQIIHDCISGLLGNVESLEKTVKGYESSNFDLIESNILLQSRLEKSEAEAVKLRREIKGNELKSARREYLHNAKIGKVLLPSFTLFYPVRRLHSLNMFVPHLI